MSTQTHTGAPAMTKLDEALESLLAEIADDENEAVYQHIIENMDTHVDR